MWKHAASTEYNMWTPSLLQYDCFSTPKAYLEPSQTSIMKFLFENN